MENELREFREKWKKEVTSKKSSPSRKETGKSSEGLAVSSSSQSLNGDLETLENEIESKLKIDDYEERVAEYLKDKNDEQKAVYYFKEASQYERRGKLNEAMKYYRKSIKLEPHVEKVLQKHNNIVLLSNDTSRTTPSSSNNNLASEDDLRIRYEDFGMHPVVSYEVPEKLPRVQFENPVFSLRPEYPQSKTHISALSSEILLYVLKFLASENIRSIEMVSAACKYFYLLSRDDHLWRHVCKVTFHAALPKTKSKRYIDKLRRFDPMPLEELVSNYHNSFRCMFLYRPHVRFDGIYISIVNYLRQGWAEDSIHHPVHVVTYYRYLRFLPNGMVYSMLTSDEPEIVVKKFKRLPRDPYSISSSSDQNVNLKTLMYGSYVIDGLSSLIVAVNDNGIIDLDPQSKSQSPATFRRSHSSRSLRSRDASPSSSSGKMTYIMRFNLDATRRMAHNKLVWEEYSGRQTRNGIDETFHYPQNMLRSFIFSRVKSY